MTMLSRSRIRVPIVVINCQEQRLGVIDAVKKKPFQQFHKQYKPHQMRHQIFVPRIVDVPQPTIRKIDSVVIVFSIVFFLNLVAIHPADADRLRLTTRNCTVVGLDCDGLLRVSKFP